MSSRGSIVLVDADAASGEVLETALGQRGFLVRSETSLAAALDALGTEIADVIVVDLPEPSAPSLELCKRVAARAPLLPIVVATLYGDLETARTMVRSGAYDFVEKPFEVDALALVLDRAVAHHALRREVALHRDHGRAPPPSEIMLGESRSIRAARDVIECVAGLDATAVITGESGTGKRLAARLLHEGNPARAGRPLVTASCSAIPGDQIEAELFGVARNAVSDGKPGLLVRAHGGTLVLDDIGALPFELQPRLLRALEQQRVQPIGGEREASFDVRLVCTTRVDLEAVVDAGRFRGDLLRRIAVVDIAMPPLRARGTDALLLAHHFLRATAHLWRTDPKSLSPAAAALLLTQRWPGNVRQLRTVLERAAALARSRDIEPRDLQQQLTDDAACSGDATLCTLEEIERRHIAHVLESVRGNRRLAAQVLGLDVTALSCKLGRWWPAGEEN